MDLDPNLARRILESVGSSGVPPEQGLEHFTVGLTPYLEVLREEYLSSFLRQGGSSFKLLVGPYGSGKTHFLYCVRDLAWKENFCVSYVPLMPEETPFHSMHLVYRAVASNIRPPGAREGGLDIMLRRRHAEVRRDLEARGARGTDLEGAVAAYAQESVEGLESAGFSRGVRRAFEALDRQQTDRFELLAAHLKGEAGGLDRKQMQELGIPEAVSRSTAPRMLRALAGWVRRIGYSGLVLLFDEAEATPSLSRRQREILVNNLRELIDRCAQGALPGVLVMYAVPDERALEGRGTAYEALKQRIATVFDVPNPTGVKILLEQVGGDAIEFLCEIGCRLSTVFQVATGARLPKTALLQDLRALAEASYAERFADVSYRRMFVQSAVAHLNRVRAEGTTGLTAEQAVEILRRFRT